jgi:hypothetical protein
MEASAILKWTRSGPVGGLEGFTAPSPQAQPPPLALPLNSGWPVDNAWNSPELHSRCLDFPAPSSWGRLTILPRDPSFAGKPARGRFSNSLGDRGHAGTGAGTNSTKQQRPTPPDDPHDASNRQPKTGTTNTRRDFLSSKDMSPLTQVTFFLTKGLQKMTPLTSGRACPFENRLDQNQKRKFVDHSPLPLDPQRPKCHLVSTSTSLCGTSTGLVKLSHRASCSLPVCPLPSCQHKPLVRRE